jgi:ADP-heptose:LPS heptosyltransferase
VQRGLRDRAVRRLFPPPPRQAPPATITRILVIRPDQLGDLLFATPALARLRAAFPAAHITGLIGPWGRPVWDRQAALNNIGELPFPGIVTRPARPWQPYTLLASAARELRPQAYDLAVNLRFDYWWGALLAEQARIPIRWGYDLPVTAPFLTHPAPYTPGRHEVEQNLALVDAVCAAAGAPPAPPPDRGAGRPPLNFPLRGEEYTWTASVLPPDGGERAVVIHPGTNASLKLWTLDGWASVATRLVALGYAVLFTGSAAEGPLVDAIRARMDPQPRATTRSLAGQTTLGQLGALCAVSRLALGVDSGPMHIATACGAPTVRLYGPSDEAVWGPWGPAARNAVVRAPGTQPGRFLDPDRREPEGGPEMQAITPEHVIAVMEPLLRGTPSLNGRSKKS